jgi:hypothetical protein
MTIGPEQLSLILGALGFFVGLISIVVAWKLYELGQKTYLETFKLLADIKSSSHTTEVTSTHFTERLVSALVELLGRDFTSTLTTAQSKTATRVGTILGQSLTTIEPELADKIRQRVQKEISDAFATLRFETANVTRLPETITAESQISGSPKTVIAPGVPRLIKWIMEEGSKFKFLSVKFLREKVFASDPALQEALQFAIDNTLLETYEVQNPKNPGRPVTACRLNQSHPVVKDILGSRG